MKNMKKILTFLLTLTLIIPFCTKTAVAATQPITYTVNARNGVYYDNSYGEIVVDGYFKNNSSQNISIDSVVLNVRTQNANLGVWQPITIKVDKRYQANDPLFSKVIAPGKTLRWSFGYDYPIPYAIAKYIVNCSINFHYVPKTYTVTKSTYIKSSASLKGKNVLLVKPGAKVTYIGTTGSYYKVSITVNKKLYTGYVLKSYLK